jgi:predicted acylesterase/phospholipase RssA
MTDEMTSVRPASYDKKVGLVLQGGGALGSYQAGVYEALAGSNYLPDWVAGISVGAINAAIIAANPQGIVFRACAVSGRRLPPQQNSGRSRLADFRQNGNIGRVPWRR